MVTRASLSNLLMLLAMLSQVATMVLGVVFHNPAGISITSDVYFAATILVFFSSITSFEKSGVDYLVSFFFLFFISLPAKVQIATGLFPWFAEISDRHLGLTFSLLALSQFSYACGQLYSTSRVIYVKRSTALSPADAKYFTKWAWGFAVFSILCAAAAGFDNLLVPRFERGGGFSGLTQQFLFMSRAISLLAILMMLYLAKFCPFSRIRRQNAVVLILFVPVFLIINYPPALARFVLFGTIISMSCIFIDYNRPYVKSIVTVVAVLFLFLVFPFTKLIATGDFDLFYFFSRIGTIDISIYMVRADFDAFMQAASAVHYIDENIGGLRWGYNFLGVFLFFIPRGMWPSKPQETGEIVSVALGYWYNNVACPLPAEALMAFGTLGPILVFFPLGYFVLKIERGAGHPKNKTSSISHFLLFAISMGFSIIILRGAINGVAPTIREWFFRLLYNDVHKKQEDSVFFGIGSRLIYLEPEQDGSRERDC